MPHLHGWMQDQEDPAFWTYGGQHHVGIMWGPTPDGTPANNPGWFVRVWPILGDVGTPDPTKPLGAEHQGMCFSSEADARGYIESWDRALKS